jgi:hypothetical protein
VEERPAIGLVGGWRTITWPKTDAGDNLPIVLVCRVNRRERQLFEVVLATHPRGGLADLLNRRQQQANENRDDCDHHEEFDQREPTTRSTEWSKHD